MSDADLAKARGVSIRTVRYHRTQRGIPAYKEIDLDKARDRLRASTMLGKYPDGVVAKKHKCPPWIVVEVREEKGISPATQFGSADLQTMPDDWVAEKYHTTVFDVFVARVQAGYARVRGKGFTHEWHNDPRLGKISDRELAQMLGCSVTTVARHRKKLHIPPAQSDVFAGVDDLGEVPDSVIARRLNISRSTVTAERIRRGIPSAREVYGTEIDWDAVSELGQVEDKVLARKLGVSRPTVVRQRVKRGIPPVERDSTVQYDWDSVMHMVGNLPDHVVANRLDAPVSTVVAFRKRNGISAFQG